MLLGDLSFIDDVSPAFEPDERLILRLFFGAVKAIWALSALVSIDIRAYWNVLSLVYPRPLKVSSQSTRFDLPKTLWSLNRQCICCSLIFFLGFFSKSRILA